MLHYGEIDGCMVRSVLHTWHFFSALWLAGQHTVRGASTWAHASCTMVELLIIISSELANNVTAIFADVVYVQPNREHYTVKSPAHC